MGERMREWVMELGLGEGKMLCEWREREWEVYKVGLKKLQNFQKTRRGIDPWEKRDRSRCSLDPRCCFPSSKGPTSVKTSSIMFRTTQTNPKSPAPRFTTPNNPPHIRFLRLNKKRGDSDLDKKWCNGDNKWFNHKTIALYHIPSTPTTPLQCITKIKGTQVCTREIIY